MCQHRTSALFGSIDHPKVTRDRRPLTTTITRIEDIENEDSNVGQQFVSESQNMGGQGSQPIHVISQSGSDLTKFRAINTTVMSEQHLIEVESQSQQRTPSNIIIEERAAPHLNVESVRLQKSPQHLIELEQRYPINFVSGQYVMAPQHIIIQQQNQQAIQRQIQIQQQVLNQ